MGIYGDNEPIGSILDRGYGLDLNKDPGAVAPPEAKNVMTDSPGVTTGGQEMGSTISLGHQFRTVGVEEDIQQVIDAVSTAGGGIVRLQAARYRIAKDINIPSNIKLMGDGRESAVIDFQGGAYAIKMHGTSGSKVRHSVIEGITVIDSTATAAVSLQWTEGAKLRDVIVVECDGEGIRIQESRFFDVDSCITSDCGADGIRVFSTNESTIHGKFIGVISQNNVESGIRITCGSGNAAVADLYLWGCRLNLNGGDGLEMDGGLQGQSAIIGCFAASNTNHGFNIVAQSISISDSFAEGNSVDGFFVNDIECRITNCKSENNSGYDWNFQTFVTFTSSNSDWGDTTDPRDLISLAGDDASNIDNVLGQSPSTHRKVVRMLNSQTGEGGYAAGRVACYAGAADLDKFSVLASGGNDKVCGMLLGFITNEEWGFILQEGWTDILKVNGTDDIAVGDFLSLHSADGVARKAQEGDMAFAIAGEAYTTDDSNGVIDALLIKPRKVGSGVPTGGIMIWSGTIASIPEGWAICDGNNGTPNMLDRFIIGVATAGTNPASSGSSLTVTSGAASNGSQVVAESPSPPTNGVPNPSHTHDVNFASVKHYRVAFIQKT